MKTTQNRRNFISLFITAGLAVGLMACESVNISAPEGDSYIQGSPPESSGAPISRIHGVNLFHLDPNNNEFENYVSSPDLVQNFSQMGWNTYRLPINWDHLSGAQGELVPEKIEKARTLVRQLVDQLRVVHESNGRDIFLIFDFHQYKFGKQCGGVGVPAGLVSSQGLNPSDHTCVFKAFAQFWENENQIQDRWIEMTLSLLPLATELARAHPWLKLGVELINEPQFGDREGLFKDDPIEAFQYLKSWVKREEPQKQVDRFLIPFYRKFLSRIEDEPYAADLMNLATFIAEPFVFDHIKIKAAFGFIKFNVQIDAHYDGLVALKNSPKSGTPLRWLAGPHHYLGAADPGILDALPPIIRNALKKYPNPYFGSNEITERILWVVNRMRDAGMQTFFGEWGTQTTLLDSRGNLGGYRSWIEDSRRALDTHTLGSLWWQYRTDPDAQQKGFYLLRTVLDDGSRVPRERQVLKCTPSSDLAFVVFGICPSEN